MRTRAHARHATPRTHAPRSTNTHRHYGSSLFTRIFGTPFMQFEMCLPRAAFENACAVFIPRCHVQPLICLPSAEFENSPVAFLPNLHLKPAPDLTKPLPPLHASTSVLLPRANVGPNLQWTHCPPNLVSPHYLPIQSQSDSNCSLTINCCWHAMLEIMLSGRMRMPLQPRPMMGDVPPRAALHCAPVAPRNVHLKDWQLK